MNFVKMEPMELELVYKEEDMSRMNPQLAKWKNGVGIRLDEED
jgi:hypothetical protein